MSMMMMTNPRMDDAASTAEQYLAEPRFAPLLSTVRRHMEERSGEVTGAVTVKGSAEQLAAVADLLGLPRAPAKGSVLVRLNDLDEALRNSRFGIGLRDAVVAASGPLVDRKARRAAAREERAEIWRAAADHPAVVKHPELTTWLASVKRRGTLRRLSCGTEARLLQQALLVLGDLPREPEPELLAILASRLLGHSHDLDPGRPAGRLVLDALAHLAGIRPGRGAEERRWLWYRYGVLCDRLSSTVLVLNLRAAGPGPLASLLATAAAEGAPLSLTLDMLQRWGASAKWTNPFVYVCENPPVMDDIARRLGPASAPLICVSGQINVAARRLLRLLIDSGVDVRYHGDFDWGGLEIGNQVMALGAAPWRYQTTDYLTAASTTLGDTLEGRPVTAMWDVELRLAMAKTGKVVFEESVVDVLHEDLAR
jgi:uncharacterized protein (TIGR02679 family)